MAAPIPTFSTNSFFAGTTQVAQRGADLLAALAVAQASADAAAASALQAANAVAPPQPVTYTLGSVHVGSSPDPKAMSVSNGLRVTDGQIISVNHNPYGFYDNAVAFSAVAGGYPDEGQTGFLGGFESGVAGIASYGAIDRGGAFIQVIDKPPLMSLTGATVGASRITGLSLTTGQVASLRVHMFIQTNQATPTTGSGIGKWETWITGWDLAGTWIDVCGWTVSGSGVTTAGQVPYGSTGADPLTLYVSPADNLFGMNLVTVVRGGQSTGWTSRGQGLEIDCVNYSTGFAQQLYGAVIQGLGFHKSAIGVAVRGMWDIGFDVTKVDSGAYRYAIGDSTAGGYGFSSGQGSGYPFIHSVGATVMSSVDANGSLYAAGASNFASSLNVTAALTAATSTVTGISTSGAFTVPATSSTSGFISLQTTGSPFAHQAGGVNKFVVDTNGNVSATGSGHTGGTLLVDGAITAGAGIVATQATGNVLFHSVSGSTKTLIGADGGAYHSGTIRTGTNLVVDGTTTFGSPTTPNDVYTSIFPGVTFSDRAASSFTTPASFTSGQQTGYATYFRNQAAASGGQRNSVGFFTAGTAEVNGAASWGFNSLLQDSPTRSIGTGTGRVLVNEADFNVTCPGTQVIGWSIGGNSLVQPTTSNGFVVNPLGTPSAGVTFKWGGAFVSIDGAADYGLVLGSTGTTGSNVSSQKATWSYRDSTGTKQSATLQAVSAGSGADGYMTLSGSSGKVHLTLGYATLYAGQLVTQAGGSGAIIGLGGAAAANIASQYVTFNYQDATNAAQTAYFQTTSAGGGSAGYMTMGGSSVVHFNVGHGDLLVSNGNLRVTGNSTVTGYSTTTGVVLSGGPTWLSGAGVPTSTQPIGSIWSRTDGGVGTTLYVSRGGGTWAAFA